MNVYLEIFGYIGTALVILSMMMTSVIKLRIFNMCGALISLIYAVCVNTWPVAVLNGCLLCINFVQTVRHFKKKEEDVILVRAGANDPTVKHLLGIWQEDVLKYYSSLNLQEMKGEETHILYVGEKAIGFFVSAHGDEQNKSDILYLAPAYRTEAMKTRVFEMHAKQF